MNRAPGKSSSLPFPGPAPAYTSPSFSVRSRTTLFSGPYASNFIHATCDVSRDGREFLMLKESGGESQTVVIHNWRTELRARTAQSAKK